MVASVAPSVVRVEADSGWGTGVVVRDDGYILTAWHVVDGASEINVRFPDGTVLPAKLKGRDVGRGLAVLSVGVSGLPALPVDGAGALALGDPVIKLGYGLQSATTPSASVGAVSALHARKRFAPAFIQTDVAVSPGDSGGPLLDGQGRLAGVVVAEGVAPAVEGAGFAVVLDAGAEWVDRMIGGETICQPPPRVLEDVNSYRDADFPWSVSLPLGFKFLDLVANSIDIYNFYDFAPAITASFYPKDLPAPPTGRFALKVSVWVNAPVSKASAGNARDFLIATAAELNEGHRKLKFLTDPRNVCVGPNQDAYEVEVLWTEFAPKLGADYEIGGFDYVSRVRWLAVESGADVYLMQGVAWPEQFQSREPQIDTVLYSFRFTE